MPKVSDLPGTYALAPAPAWTVQRVPQTGQVVAESGVQAEYALDTDIYGQDRFLPVDVVTLDETAFVRQQRIARVTVRPVQFNPARGQIRVVEYLRVEVSFPATQLSAAPSIPEASLDDTFDPILQHTILNFEQARQWRVPRQALGPAKSPTPESYPGDTSRPWFKAQVRFSGLYKVTLADLQEADLAPLAAANPLYLQVWKDGQQVSTQFIGDTDTIFEPTEQLLFYANVELDIYSETDTVWLTVGNGQAMHMVTADATPAGGVTDSFLPAKVHFEEDSVYLMDVPRTGTPAYPRWYGVELSTLGFPSRTVQAVVPNPITSGYNAQLRVRFAGSTESGSGQPRPSRACVTQWTGAG